MTSISSRAAECSIAFESLVQSRVDQPDELIEVENHLFRFRLWAHNNSVLSQGRDSMDWSLRRAPVPRSIVIDSLDDLLQAIFSVYHPSVVLNYLTRYFRATQPE